MNKLKLAVMLCCSLSIVPNPATAFDPGNLTIKSGSGEEITYKKGMFGKKQVLVKDRIGNKYEKKKGMLGGRSKEVSVLGNQYKSSHSVLGDKAEGRSFFGDTVTVKKGMFGRRSTEVDLSGISGVVKGLMGSKEPFSDAPADFSSEDLLHAYKEKGPVDGNTLENNLKEPGSPPPQYYTSF